MYSMLNGLVVLLEEGGAKGLGFLRRVASLHKSVNSAMESTRCWRSVTMEMVEPDKSREQKGTSRKW